jgi:hypothetical protein
VKKGGERRDEGQPMLRWLLKRFFTVWLWELLVVALIIFVLMKSLRTAN